MALKRIIPVLLLSGSGLVKTVRFSKPRYVGDPINAIRIFNEKEADEIVVLDINATSQNRKPDFGLIESLATEAFMPLAYGGGVRGIEDFERLYKCGVEKVIVSSLLHQNPAIVKEAVAHFGAQAVVACLDYKTGFFGTKKIVADVRTLPGLDVAKFAEYVTSDLGVGEVFLQSIDRDGTWLGYDTETARKVVNSVSTPVIVAGGCGSIDDIRTILYDVKASASAIGSMAVFSGKDMGVLINMPSRELVVKE